MQIKFTPVRVVCHNTLTMALKEGETSIRVPHTRDLKDRLELARQSLNLIRTGYAHIETDFVNMAKIIVYDARLALYVRLVFPDPKTKAPRDLDRVAKDRARASVLFQKGRGNDIAGVAYIMGGV